MAYLPDDVALVTIAVYGAYIKGELINFEQLFHYLHFQLLFLSLSRNN